MYVNLGYSRRLCLTNFAFVTVARGKAHNTENPVKLSTEQSCLLRGVLKQYDAAMGNKYINTLTFEFNMMFNDVVSLIAVNKIN